MKRHYHYHLLHYDGPASRFRCPGCGRYHCFTPYVDDDGVPADLERYGRCDHESSCGYHLYPPYEPIRHGGYISAGNKFEKRPSKARLAPRPNPCTIPANIVAKSVVFTPKNAFLSFLCRVFCEPTARAMMDMYQIGTTKEGYTVFYQIDTKGRVRSGKIIPYDPQTGHRIKDGSVPEALWVHSRLKALHQLPDNWTLTQCLFGEHLLALYPDKPVALVEAEKTAVICAAALPEYIWLATCGKSQLGSKLDVLKGRKVVAYPDVDAYDLWKERLSTLGIEVSDLLERTATEDEWKRKIDLADRIIEERLYGCQRNFDCRIE